jgi:hypothetical protein
MGSGSSSELPIRDLMRRADMVDSGRLAAVSRATADAARIQRRTQAARLLRPQGRGIEWALATPGAGHASRHLLANPPEGQVGATQRFAREGAQSCYLLRRSIRPDFDSFLADPGRIRPLIERSPDTSWLSSLFERAIETLNWSAVDMLLEIPTRVPPVRDMFDVIQRVAERGHELVRYDDDPTAGPELTRQVMRVLPHVLRFSYIPSAYEPFRNLGMVLSPWADPEEVSRILKPSESCSPLALQHFAEGAMLARLVNRDLPGLGRWTDVLGDDELGKVAALVASTALIPYTRRLVASGVLDIAHDHGYVRVFPGNVEVRNKHLSRAGHPELDAWAASKE